MCAKIYLFINIIFYFYFFIIIFSYLYNNENLKGKALTIESLEDCRYCTSFENNCSSLKCYEDNDNN